MAGIAIVVVAAVVAAGMTAAQGVRPRLAKLHSTRRANGVSAYLSHVCRGSAVCLITFAFAPIGCRSSALHPAHMFYDRACKCAMHMCHMGLSVMSALPGCWPWHTPMTFLDMYHAYVTVPPITSYTIQQYTSRRGTQFEYMLPLLPRDIPPLAAASLYHLPRSYGGAA